MKILLIIVLVTSIPACFANVQYSIPMQKDEQSKVIKQHFSAQTLLISRFDRSEQGSRGLREEHHHREQREQYGNIEKHQSQQNESNQPSDNLLDSDETNQKNHQTEEAQNNRFDNSVGKENENR